jgi:hypothetical protein
VNKLIETKEFSQWLSALRDRAARSRIATRMERLVDGNAGQVRGVGGGVSELKIALDLAIECTLRDAVNGSSSFSAAATRVLKVATSK